MQIKIKIFKDFQKERDGKNSKICKIRLQSSFGFLSSKSWNDKEFTKLEPKTELQNSRDHKL